jgi:hypothetical protein
MTGCPEHLYQSALINTMKKVRYTCIYLYDRSCVVNV